MKNEQQKSPPLPHYYGHRERLKERFLKNPNTLPDYEILELFLYWVYPRKDVKPLAKQLLNHFGNLKALAHASLSQLEEMRSPSTFIAFELLREFSRRLLIQELHERSLLNNSEKVLAYCRLTMEYLSVEVFRLFFLDKKHYLIADEIQHTGTLDETSLYPREVMKRALSLNAAGIIMLHNHPSGDPSPSKADIALTHQLKAALFPFNIRVLDHFIIGKYGYFSFREQRILSA